MGRPKTNWQENTWSTSVRFNLADPDQKRAVEILQEYRTYGRSIQSILTTALLASEGQQFTEPTLGDSAAQQIMIGVRELGELILELRQLRFQAGIDTTPITEDDADGDYEAQIAGYLQGKRDRE